MNKAFFTLGILAAMAVISCKNRSYEISADISNVDTILYDTEHPNIIPRDSIYDSVRYIKLETKKECLIGNVDDILLGDSTIVVMDKYIAQAAFLFDYNGHYLGQLSKMGRGPKEYLRVSDVALFGGKIVLLDEIKGKMMFFDERGHYLDEIDSEIFATAVEFIDSDNILFDISERYSVGHKPYGDYSFVLKNRNMDIKYLFGKPNHGKGFNFCRTVNLIKCGDSIYGNVNYMDVIYVLDKDGARAKYNLVLKPYSGSDFPFTTQDELFENHRRYSYFNGEFIELKDYSYIFYRAHENENIYSLLYNHKTKTTRAISNGFDDPMSCFFYFPIARYSDNTLVCAVKSSQMNWFKGTLNDALQDSEMLQNLYSDISNDSNPVLFFYQINTHE